MVSGADPGPAPTAQALFNSSELTASKDREWAQVKLRRKVPSVEGAGIHWPMTPSQRPERSTSASSMLSPPARVEVMRPIALAPTLACPTASPRSTLDVDQLTEAQVAGQSHG